MACCYTDISYNSDDSSWRAVTLTYVFKDSRQEELVCMQ